uniref:Signal peptidase complex catalytic subunit SEC11 n=1 Tax=Equus asinus TaxID=9793 RepID=A0A8C4LCF3_EQUAS
MLSLDFLDDVRRMNKRQLYYQVLNFGMIVSSALMIWKGLMVITGSESPIVVVLSGSMEPAFHRGDLLFLTNRVEDPIRVGEIVVFRIEGREIPIVHRVLKIHEKQNGHIKFLTKGDNNAVDDRGLYKQGQHWLEKKDVVGRARGFYQENRSVEDRNCKLLICSLYWDCDDPHE